MAVPNNGAHGDVLDTAQTRHGDPHLLSPGQAWTATCTPQVLSINAGNTKDTQDNACDIYIPRTHKETHKTMLTQRHSSPVTST